MKDFYDLFLKELREIYHAEKKMCSALPKMAKAATTSKLKECFNRHYQETKQQVKRLEKIFKELNEKTSGFESHVINELLRECNRCARANYIAHVKDAALINAAQHIEHWEIATYGTLKTFAEHLGFTKAVKLLEETEKEEAHADKTLTKIAEGSAFSQGVNTKACMRLSA